MNWGSTGISTSATSIPRSSTPRAFAMAPTSPVTRSSRRPRSMTRIGSPRRWSTAHCIPSPAPPWAARRYWREWGCKPEPPKFPSSRLQPRNERIQVDALAVGLAVPVQQDVQPPNRRRYLSDQTRSNLAIIPSTSITNKNPQPEYCNSTSLRLRSFGKLFISSALAPPSRRYTLGVTITPIIPPSKNSRPQGPPCLKGARTITAGQFFKWDNITSIFVLAVCNAKAVKTKAPPISINATQRNIVSATLRFILSPRKSFLRSLRRLRYQRPRLPKSRRQPLQSRTLVYQPQHLVPRELCR